LGTSVDLILPAVLERTAYFSLTIMMKNQQILKRMKKMKTLITRIMKGKTVYKMNIDIH
jgi:hypothetical protein